MAVTIIFLHPAECSHFEMFCKKEVLNNWQNSQDTELCRSLFLFFFSSCRSAVSLKRDSSTVIFLWIFGNVSDHYRNFNGCFYPAERQTNTVIKETLKAAYNVYSESVFNTLYIVKKHKCLKKIPSDKIKGTKNALFFLSRAPTHHSFTFNLRLLYEPKHKVRLSKTVWYFPFSILFRFIKVYVFVQQNAWTL